MTRTLLTKESCFIVLIAIFIISYSAKSQDTTFNDSQLRAPNQLCLGINTYYFGDAFDVIQITYRRENEIFILRGGLGFRFRNFANEFKISNIPFMLNVGLEKTLLNVSNFYLIYGALDLSFTKFRNDLLLGPSVTLTNAFEITYKSLISMEVGLAFAGHLRKGHKFNGPEIFFSRPFTLSYHYRF